MVKMRLRRSKPITSDTLPVPPEALRYRVIGDYDLNNFLRGGADTVGDIKAALTAADQDFDTLKTVLDFGCGCGRTVRWLADASRTHRIHGSDFDVDAIAWCQQNLPFARFHVNQPLPRTTFASRQFDLICALSVFTHLNEEYQFQWLRELKRILKPSGILVASVHGRHYIDALPPEQIAAVEKTGFFFLEGEYWKGIFPDWYQNAFHTERYIADTFARDFDLLAHLPQGLGKRQDIVVLQKPRWRLRRKPARRLPSGTP
ncbi:MAG: class I SAM-dependent methyltransferase [Thermomicrobiales bacterium]